MRVNKKEKVKTEVQEQKKEEWNQFKLSYNIEKEKKLLIILPYISIYLSKN